MAEIAQELDTIQNDIYGRNVKQAIHDALDKINKDVESLDPGGGGGDEPFGTPIDRGYGVDDVVAGNSIPRCKIVQDYEDSVLSSDTLTIVTTTPGMLLVCVMHRGNVSIGSGFVKIAESEPAVYDNVEQRITVWRKYVLPGENTVTVTQDQQIRMTMKLVVLTDVSYSSMTSITKVQDEAITSFPITPTAKNGKQRLYMLSTIFASRSDSDIAIIVNQNGTTLQIAEERRFNIYYDGDTNGTALPIFDYSPDLDTYEADSANILVLDIAGP